MIGFVLVIIFLMTLKFLFSDGDIECNEEKEEQEKEELSNTSNKIVLENKEDKEN